MEIFVLVTQLSWPLCRLSAFTEKNFLIKTFYSIFFHIPNAGYRQICRSNTTFHLFFFIFYFWINPQGYNNLSGDWLLVTLSSRSHTNHLSNGKIFAIIVRAIKGLLHLPPIYSPIRVPVRECLQSPIARNNQLAADLPRPCQAANPVFTPASHSFSQPQPAAGKLFSF